MKKARLRRVPIFVCGKCLKRHGDGKALRRALKTHAKACDAKLVRSACLGVCPKAAVVVVTRRSLEGGRAELVATAEDAARLSP